MHLESTTDLSIIYSNLNKLKSNKENIILISTGEMNPIHRCHISNMIKTKQYLENIHDYNVIAGYISPTHDEYVQEKLGNYFIPSHHRINMCQKAIQEENQQDWLAVDKVECMDTFLNNVTYSLQEFINKNFNMEKAIRVIYVAGLDLFNRCHGMNFLGQSHIGGVVVVYRYGQNTSRIKSFIDKNSLKISFILLDNQDDYKSYDISSTLIRQKLKLNENCSRLTYNSVLEYLQTIPNYY
ncbi:unnamed protein product [Rotaria sordida]|uniref:Cytidyltransferase-like domain-containing protein n=1 Tax=Rotaria sordida TaxID=392033 RepID=A0A819XX10_9BILA|nr:unnamed protein product [Rotaria sordida]CAF4149054.1 unnamed protein product [Rotaria sordida]